MNKIELSGHIISGELEYDISLKEMKTKIEKFKDKNNQSDFVWTLEVVDKARHYQHKYYRGFLLPDVADAMGERDNLYVHFFILKREFLYNQFESFDKIPAKFRSRAFLYYSEIVTNEGEIKPPHVYGWSPSTGDIGFDAMDEYIKKVENYLLVNCEGHLGQSGGSKYKERQLQAIETRDKIHNIIKKSEIENKDLFSF